MPAALHVDGAHEAVAGRHAPEPLQVLVVNVAPVHEAPGQSPSGSVASRLAVQVPFFPATPDFDDAHAWQAPLHAVSQQNPSTHKPFTH